MCVGYHLSVSFTNTPGKSNTNRNAPINPARCKSVITSPGTVTLLMNVRTHAGGGGGGDGGGGDGGGGGDWSTHAVAPGLLEGNLMSAAVLKKHVFPPNTAPAQGGVPVNARHFAQQSASDTAVVLGPRFPWCRSVFGMNMQFPGGSVRTVRCSSVGVHIVLAVQSSMMGWVQNNKNA